MFRNKVNFRFSQNINHCQKTQRKHDLTLNYPLPLKTSTHREILQSMCYSKSKDLYSQEVQQESEVYIEKVKGIGVYTHSQGADYIRSSLANKINSKHGLHITFNDIFLTKGGNHSLQVLFQLLLDINKDNIMIQTPTNHQIYKMIKSSQIKFIPSYANGNYDNLTHDLKNNNKDIKLFLLTNPTNPGGQFIPKSTLKEILTVCADLSIPIIADERMLGLDFKHTQSCSVLDLVSDFQNKLELFTINSLNYMEPGLRSGIIKAYNIDPDVKFQLYKVMSISLPSSVTSQVASNYFYGKDSSIVDIVTYEHMKNFVNNYIYQMINLELDNQDYVGNSVFLRMKRINQKNQNKDQMENFKVAIENDYVERLDKEAGIKVLPGNLFGTQPNDFRIYANWGGLGNELDTVMERWVEFDQNYNLT